MKRLLLIALMWGSPAFAQQHYLRAPTSEPRLQVKKFAMPLTDYQAPDGTWKRGHGIIVGRDVAPNATVGLGLFRIKPKTGDGPSTPFAGKSKKVAVGVTLSF